MSFCPLSDTKGKAVEYKTPAHLLLDSSLLGDGPHFFCPGPDCDVVYFSEDGSETHRKADVRVRVGLKETEDPVPVCYCFEHTRADLRAELERDGETTIPQRIKDEIAAGRCACDVKNPEGTCCLGNVMNTVRAVEKELENG